MTITRFRTPYRPFGSLNLLQEALQQLGQDETSLSSGNFVPAVNVYEDDQKLSVSVETPGIREEDLKLQVENQTLTISGERGFDKEQKEENFHRIERRYGSFARSFHLPTTVDTQSAKASYANGVLAVEFGKRSELKAREIKIGAGNELNATSDKRNAA